LGLLTDRVAVITGAGRGLGREIAFAYAAEGADITLVSKTLAELKGVAKEAAASGTKVLPVQADIRRETDVRDLVQTVLRGLGRIDILVNNAGVTPGAAGRPIHSLLDVRTTFWDETFNVNCRGAFLMMREVLPGMVAKGGGAIISITSKLSRIPQTGNVPYGPSKAALELLTQIVDTEFQSHGIRANLLHPGGPVATTIFNDFYQPPPGSDVASPGIIREPAVWLASDAAVDVHGAVIDARIWAATQSLQQGASKLGGEKS
jgi:NAD(P)-dependent dehydrogenase (short-subunit alcohol dehydrogenase family)